MTNLTKERRADIINSVVLKGTNLPAKKADLTKRTEQRIREILLAVVPKEFAAATKNLPATWFPHLSSMQVYYPVNPISIITFSEEHLRKNRYWGQSVMFEPIKHPFTLRFDRTQYQDQRNSDGKPEVNKDSWEYLLADLIKEAKKIRAEEDNLVKELTAFLASVKTYKQVLEKMPELERHLPGIEAKAYPVAVSVTKLVKTLQKSGFDQSDTEKAA